MFILIGLFLMYASLPLMHKGELLLTRFVAVGGLCVGFSLTFLWMTSLCFDVWRSVK